MRARRTRPVQRLHPSVGPQTHFPRQRLEDRASARRVVRSLLRGAGCLAQIAECHRQCAQLKAGRLGALGVKSVELEAHCQVCHARRRCRADSLFEAQTTLEIMNIEAAALKGRMRQDFLMQGRIGLDALDDEFGECIAHAGDGRLTRVAVRDELADQ